MRKQWLAVGALGVAIVVAIYVLLRAGGEIALVEVGSRAPDFRAKHLARGDTVSLAHYRGQVVLLNIWATWCLPCRVEMPSMQRLYGQFRDSGFVVVAVSIDKDDEKVVRDFAQELGLTFDVLHDAEGVIQQIYQTTGVPESFVISRDGIITKRVMGAREWDGPVDHVLLRRLLGAPGGGEE